MRHPILMLYCINIMLAYTWRVRLSIMVISARIEQFAKAQLLAKLERLERSTTIKQLNAPIMAEVRNQLRRPPIELDTLVRVVNELSCG